MDRSIRPAGQSFPGARRTAPGVTSRAMPSWGGLTAATVRNANSRDTSAVAGPSAVRGLSSTDKGCRTIPGASHRASRSRPSAARECRKRPSCCAFRANRPSDPPSGMKPFARRFHPSWLRTISQARAGRHLRPQDQKTLQNTARSRGADALAKCRLRPSPVAASPGSPGMQPRNAGTRRGNASPPAAPKDQEIRKSLRLRIGLFRRIASFTATAAPVPSASKNSDPVDLS